MTEPAWRVGLAEGHVGDARAVMAAMEPESVHLSICSPPFYALRRYQGEQEVVWGGTDGCDHLWGEATPGVKPGQVPQTKWAGNSAVAEGQQATTGRDCLRCQAYLCALGLERVPSCGRSESGLLELRDDLTPDEKAYVLSELQKAGLL